MDNDELIRGSLDARSIICDVFKSQLVIKKRVRTGKRRYKVMILTRVLLKVFFD